MVSITGIQAATPLIYSMPAPQPVWETNAVPCATLTQAPQPVNAMKPGEVDSCSYQVTQSTAVQSRGRYDYTIMQTQRSQLHAGYHAPLQAGGSLALDGGKASQNYYRTQIDDSAQAALNGIHSLIGLPASPAQLAGKTG